MMNISRYLLLLHLAIATTAMATAQPRLAVAGGDTVDFGTVPPESIRRDVRLVNVGDRPLHIEQVNPSCGCTLAPLDRVDLAPGDTATMQVTVDMTMKSGVQTTQIMVRSNDSLAPARRIVVRASVLREITTGSLRFPMIWNGKLDTETETSLELTNNSSVPVTFTGARIGENEDLEMRVALPSGLTLAPGESYRLKATVRPRKKGMTRGRVVIATTSKQTPEITLQVDCIVRAMADQ